MLYCTHCKVNVSTTTDICPLCHNKLIGETENTIQTFPKYTKPLSTLKLCRLLIDILAPLAIFVTVLINLLTFNGVLWSVIDAIVIIYLWCFGLWTFRKDGSLGKKIAVNAITINIIIVCVNIFGYNLAVLPGELWSLTYVAPFLLASILLVNNVVIFTKKYAIKEFLLSQFSLCFIAIASFVTFLCVFSWVLFPIIIVLSMAGTSLILYSIFHKKILKQEFVKTFHI